MLLALLGLVITSLSWGGMHGAEEGCLVFGGGMMVLGALKMTLRAVD